MKTGRDVFNYSKYLTNEKLKLINKELKITQSQISNAFDIFLLMIVDHENKDSDTYIAYFDYLRKKTEKLNSKKLFYTRIHKKFFEFEGEVVPIDYSMFINKNPKSKEL